MIARVYVDNYKCLSNFECKFGHINLVLGTNGSGKSTLFEVLRNLQAVVTGRSPIGVFNESTLTRWQQRNLQTFEVEIHGNGGVYEYHLEVEHEIGENKERIRVESVKGTDRRGSGLLYRAQLGEVQLFRDDYSEGPVISTDWRQSGISFLGERHDNTRLTWLKSWFKQSLLCLQIDPLHVKAEADTAEEILDEHAANYVGWYRQRIATDMGATIDLYESLKDLYGDFQGLKLDQKGGAVPRLFVRIGVREEPDGRPAFVNYGFGELSEGERALIILHSLLQLMGDPHTSLCLDEPDNFLALGAIQPWLLSLKDAVEAGGSQALLISHHPELIDNLAPSCGLVFERQREGPIRVKPFAADDGVEAGLRPSEVVAQGLE